MDDFVIYLNKYTRYTVAIFILMGITYIFLGISSLLKADVFNGFIQLSFALLALGLLVLNSLPVSSGKLKLKLSTEGFYYRESLLYKALEFEWKNLETVEIKKSRIYFKNKSGGTRSFSLSALNYNEQQFLIIKLPEYFKPN